VCLSFRMTLEKRLSAPKRRTRAEVQQIVAEFMSSGMRRSEFWRSRGLSFGTLNRHLQKRRWRRKGRAVSSAGRPAGWFRWSWPPRNRRGSTNRVAGWPWCCRAGAGLRYILILIRIRSSAWWVSWSGFKPCLDWVHPHGSIWPPESPTCARDSKGCTVRSGIDCL
jgi:hypothetical protein